MKALIVDDSACLRELFQLYLQDMEFETEAAPDGGVAFQMIQNSEYDIIISDMDMPSVNGIELYKLIHAHKPELLQRLLFATAEGADGKYKTFFREITCPVIEKPFSFSDFKNSIESIATKAAA